MFYKSMMECSNLVEQNIGSVIRVYVSQIGEYDCIIQTFWSVLWHLYEEGCSNGMDKKPTN